MRSQSFVDDDPVVRFVCRKSEARWHPGRFVVVGLGKFEVVVAGFDGVPVELCLNLEVSLEKSQSRRPSLFPLAQKRLLPLQEFSQLSFVIFFLRMKSATPLMGVDCLPIYTLHFPFSFNHMLRRYCPPTLNSASVI